MDKILKNSDWKKVLITSSHSSFPVLLYCGLSYVLLQLFTPYLSKLLSKNGYIVTENMTTFFKYILIYMVIFPIIILCFRLISKKENKIRIKLGFCRPQKSFLWILKWLTIAFSVSMIAMTTGSMVLFIISAITGIDVTGANLFLASASLLTVPTYIVDTIPPLLFAPIMEEILFRGFIYKNDEKLGWIFAGVTSSLLFGAWHQTLSQFILGLVLGFFSCFLYAHTKSIFPSMILHFINNLKSVAGVFLLKKLGFTSALNYAIDVEELVKNHLIDILWLFVLLFVMGVVVILGLVLLVVDISNHSYMSKRKSNASQCVENSILCEEQEINKAEQKMPTIKKALLYYCSPLTVATYAVLIYGLITRLT